MKRLTVVLAAMAMMMSTVAFAEDGAALYKAKCAMCHGAAGEGKSAPAIKGNADVASVLSAGGKKTPHARRLQRRRHQTTRRQSPPSSPA